MRVVALTITPSNPGDKAGAALELGMVLICHGGKP